MARLRHGQRKKIVERVKVWKASQGTVVLDKYKEKNKKVVFCLSGRLVAGEDKLFRIEGQSYGAKDIYEENTSHFKSNVIADPYCIVAEISREQMEQILGEDFKTVL